MLPTKKGQIVKFHAPMEDENPNQLYVVLELKIDGERDRADIQPLGTNLPFPGINTVSLQDLDVVEVETSDLIGHQVTIQKSDFSEATGKVLSTSKQKIFLDLSNNIHGVETNVWLTILDGNGNEQTGTLVIR
jgi:transcription antitermination factor NusG